MHLNAYWGIFASQILNNQHDEAFASSLKITSIIDNFPFPSKTQELNSRNWLNHWILLSLEGKPERWTNVQ